MATPRFLCRVSILESDAAHDGQNENYSYIIHLEKKTFTLGTSNEADIRVAGDGISPIHAEITVEVPNLYIKNLSSASTCVSAHQIGPDHIEPFRSGEAIRLGKSKQVVIIELFRKFVGASEESESIIKEANEKARLLENSMAEQKRELLLLNKKAQEQKIQLEKEWTEKNESAKSLAEEIQKTALQNKNEIIESAKVEAAAIIQKADAEIKRTIDGIKVNAEEQKRDFMEQARLKAKAIKNEAESEAEALIASGQKEADILIEAARAKASEIVEESRREVQNLATIKINAQNKINDLQKIQDHTKQEIENLKAEARKFSEIKKQIQQDFNLEKERLHLAAEDLKKALEIDESQRRALHAEVENLKSHHQHVTNELAKEKLAAQTYLEKCQLESQHALQASERAAAQLAQSQSDIGVINQKLSELQNEYNSLSQAISDLKVKEENERQHIRAKLKKEYDVRLEFEKKWHTKHRENEIEQMEKERLAKAQLETERLRVQVQSISASIQSLLTLELSNQFGDQNIEGFKMNLDNLVTPIVNRCIIEEYEYRRDHWQNVATMSFGRQLAQRAKTFKRQFGVTTLSLVLFLAAVTLAWNSPIHSKAMNREGLSCVSKNQNLLNKTNSEDPKMTTAESSYSDVK